eukprot:6523137-Pyramimonas_sp.AAC.1
MSIHSDSSDKSRNDKLLDISKRSNTSEFGSISKQLAQDEVSRIREEMRKVRKAFSKSALSSLSLLSQSHLVAGQHKYMVY